MKGPVPLLVLLAAAGCWSGEAAPTYREEFRALGPRTRTEWLTTLQDRYGCDSVFVKMDAHPPLSVGIRTCDAARWVQPETVRAWADSTGVREEWEYLGGRRGSGPWDKPWLPRQGRCTLELRGPSPRLMLVSRQSC